MKIAGWLQQLDEGIFSLINVDGAPLWLDKLMMTLRYPITWVPLYIILLIVFYKKSPRYFFPLLLTTIVTFALTDYISASVLKPFFERLRPCHDEENIGIAVRHVVACGGKYSMPSSHATNHFGLAMCWYSIAALLYKQKWYWVWGWAFVICYAQVYVGVHYPLDILVGALLGILIGFCTFSLFKKWYRLKESNNNKKAFHFT